MSTTPYSKPTSEPLMSWHAPSGVVAWLDRIAAVAMIAAVAGSVLSFGGAVWWYPAWLAVCVSLLALTTIARAFAARGGVIVRSPLNILGLGLLAIACLQVIPWPASFADTLSAQSPTALERIESAATGAIRDQPAVPTSIGGRLALSADRSTTLRCLMHGLALFVIFLIVGGYTDRLSRTRVIWNSLLAAFAFATIVALLQLAAGSRATYGLWPIGQGPAWAPSEADLLDGPVTYRLRALPSSNEARPLWLTRRPTLPFSIGPLATGGGAYLGLAALALPLLLASILQRIAPRGSVEPLFDRLRAQGGAAALFLLVALLASSSALVGYFGGTVLGTAIGIGIAITGVLSLRKAGVTRSGLALSALAVASIASGVLLGRYFGRPEGGPWLALPSAWPQVRSLWNNAVVLGRAFPVFGIGMGGFGALAPYLKSQDLTSSTAQSSAFQWWAESGAAGFGILVVATIWIVAKIPAAWRNVGTADRPLAAGFVGSLVGFGLLSCVHWTIQQPAVALTSVAILGAAHRWLAGGTDVFVDDAELAYA